MLQKTSILHTFKGVLRRHLNGPDGLPLYNELNKQWLCREGERWWTLDASGQQLPRVASLAAYYITGQHRPDFNPGMMAGDNVIILNCKDVVMVGDDWVRIPITWHTAWAGGQYRVRLSDMYERDPCMLMYYYIRKAIKYTHGRKLKCRQAPIEKAYVYEDAIHPHADKAPRPIHWHDFSLENRGGDKSWTVSALMR